MARRADHSREELKEMAIEAGYNIIQSQGFSKFSARGVASEIGYTVGTIYNVFGTHDNLILHISAKTLDLWFEDLQRVMQNAKKPLTLRDLASYYIAYSAAHYNEWMALFEHTMSDVPEWFTEKLRRFFDLLEGIVLPHVGGNRAKARSATRVLWSGIHGISILSLSQKLDLVGAESADKLARSFIDTYLRGLQAEA